MVVDFWAPWCGPCQYLGPVIEKLAAEANGRWVLEKVNTDEHPGISAQYGIRGIPAVKMFYNGEVIAEFTGALPEHRIKAWLDENIPDERKKQLAALKTRLRNSPDANSLQELETLVANNPDLKEAAVLLARYTVLDDPGRAVRLLEPIREGDKWYDEAKDIRDLASLMSCSLNGESGMEKKLLEAREALRNADYETALERLIEVIMIDKSFCDEMPRRACVAIFHLLGHEHELTKKYMRRFSMALY